MTGKGGHASETSLHTGDPRTLHRREFVSCLGSVFCGVRVGRATGLSRPRGGSRLSRVRDLVPGWLYHERKLHAAYRALQTKIHTGKCLTLASQQQYLANYFASIVRAATAEFCLERSSRVARQVPDAVLSAIPEIAAPNTDVLQGRILSVLPRLPPDLRVPFWLRYFRVFGPLSETDTA
jgi:hypothetical protein